MNRRLSRRWIVIAAVVFGAAVAVASLIGRRREYRTVAGVQATLNEAGVRPGVSAERVFAVLDSLEANHSELATDDVVTVRFGRSFSGLFVRGEIAGTFRFDTAGRLVSRELEERLTGP